MGGVGGSEGLDDGAPVVARATEVTPNVLSGSSTTCEERSAMSTSEMVRSGAEAKWYKSKKMPPLPVGQMESTRTVAPVNADSAACIKSVSELS